MVLRHLVVLLVLQGHSHLGQLVLEQRETCGQQIAQEQNAGLDESKGPSVAHAQGPSRLAAKRNLKHPARSTSSDSPALSPPALTQLQFANPESVLTPTIANQIHVNYPIPYL